MKKKIILWISSVMLLLVLCTVLTEMQEMNGKVQAEEGQENAAWGEESMEAGTGENSDMREGEDSDVGTEENMEEEDMVTAPEVLYPEPDGKDGYYINCPEIKIVHKEKGWVTEYELLLPDGNKKAGILETADMQEEVFIVLSEMLEEGENILKVWMEETTGEEEKMEENGKAETDENETEKLFFREIHFLMDSTAPQFVKFTYDRAETGNILYANEPFEVFVESEDTGSGIAEICYKTDSGEAGTITGNKGSIVLNPGFSGRIEACSVDRAGNRSEKSISKAILCENISPMIQIQIEDGEQTWHSDPVSVSVDIWDQQLSAGIQSFKCYCDGKVIVQKMSERGEISLNQMSTNFIVDTAAKDGQGIPVVVEVVDWAGNFRTESRVIYYDSTAPGIHMKGVHDGMISGQKTDAVITAEDDNLLAFARFELWRTAPDGVKERIVEKTEHAEEFRENMESEWMIAMEEDGIYEIIAEAEDSAGNRTEESFRIVVDKTSPVIRYVNQMQGVYIPYFQWNYRADDMVEEFTEYTFEILLNGFPYSAGAKIREEGIKLLQVTAVDEAGNKASVEAVFVIDHTSPYISIYGVEEGEIYEGEAELSVSVDGGGEFLKEITVNGERMKLENTGQIFQKIFIEPGDYEVCILAEDLAGNQSERRILFSVVEKKVPAVKIIHSIEKILEKDAERGNQSEPEEEKRNVGIWLTAAILIGMGILIPYVRKRNS